MNDADFVTTQLRVGLLEARAKDEAIPLKYDVIGQETNGPGGLFKALRTIPVILDICKDMEELCPNAWLIANPAGMVTEAVLRYTNIQRVVGLCNVPIGIRMGLARLLEVDASRVHVDFAGLNHMVYGLDVYLDGVSVMDACVRACDRSRKANYDGKYRALNWEPDFIRGLRAIPCYYYKTREMLEEEKEASVEKGTRAEVVKQLENDLFELYKTRT